MSADLKPNWRAVLFYLVGLGWGASLAYALIAEKVPGAGMQGLSVALVLGLIFLLAVFSLLYAYRRWVAHGKKGDKI